jgi:catechol 2,3-dioxygenase-like lactoylglutathione lyase family enzyme
VDEAIRFWSNIFGADSYIFGHQPESGRAHLATDEKPASVTFSGIVLHFSRAEGISGWDKEYPHVAFNVTSQQLRTLKARLEGAGVKTHPVWTRNKVEALMYFRDPSGNLFEFFCWQYDQVAGVELDAHKGGAFRPPVGDLTYDWSPQQGVSQ